MTTRKVVMPELPQIDYKTIWGWNFEYVNDKPELDEDMFFAQLPNGICLDCGVYGFKSRNIILKIFIDGWDWQSDEDQLFLERICPDTLEEAAETIVKKINKYSKYPKAPEEIRIGRDAERNYIDLIWGKNWIENEIS